MGFELEIDLGESDPNFIRYKEPIAGWITEYSRQHKAPLYVKHDGSLQAGLEIVSMPCTLEYHLNLQSFYEDLFSILINLGFRSHDTNTCGLHIHINRTYFHKTNKLKQDIEILKLLTLVDKFYSQIEIISRRKSNKYCKRFAHYDARSNGGANLYHEARSIGKYSCVNLEHQDTIEFRMFRGTLKAETFISTLEFISILAKVSKSTSAEDIDSIEWTDLEEYFSPTLKAYVEDRMHRNGSLTIIPQSQDIDELTDLDNEWQSTFYGNRCTQNYTDDISEAVQRILDNMEIRHVVPPRGSCRSLASMLRQAQPHIPDSISLEEISYEGSYPLADAHYSTPKGELLLKTDEVYISCKFDPDNAELTNIRMLSFRKYLAARCKYHKITNDQHQRASYAYRLRGADWNWIYDILINPPVPRRSGITIFQPDSQPNNKLRDALRKQIEKLRTLIKFYKPFKFPP